MLCKSLTASHHRYMTRNETVPCHISMFTLNQVLREEADITFSTSFKLKSKYYMHNIGIELISETSPYTYTWLSMVHQKHFIALLMFHNTCVLDIHVLVTHLLGLTIYWALRLDVYYFLWPVYYIMLHCMVLYFTSWSVTK